MENQVFESEIVIRETHLDTFGHVNNAVYLTLFEQARWAIVAPRGFGLDDIRRSGLGPTLLEVKLQWKREIKNREKITIRTWVTSAAGKVQNLRQVMVKESGEEACQADYVLALFDVKARRLVEPTPEWKAAIGLA